MSIFEKLNQEKDYKSLIEDFNPMSLSNEQQKFINEYKTPNRSYIKTSARGVGYDVVSSNTLKYILITCFECSRDEKYQAVIIAIYRIYLNNKGNKDIENTIEEAKKKLMPYVLEPSKREVVDLSFLDDVIKGHTPNFIYVLQITIGVNTILKYGKTTQAPRQRLAQIKSDIAAKYTNQAIKIEPILLIHCKDASVFEDEIKVTFSENNIFPTGYNFKGVTETFKQKDKHLAINNIVLSLVKKYNAEILYDSSMPKSDTSSIAEEVSPFEN